MAMTDDFSYVEDFSNIGIDDVARVGGKNASLGEMVRELTPLGVQVPGGFAITAEGFRAFIEAAGLRPTLEELLAGLDKENLEDFARRGRALREAVYAAPLPADLAAEIRSAYAELEEQYGAHTDVAVRSSATAEDLPGASFAGQHDTFLNIHSAGQLLDAVKRCFASLFTDRAISYRIDQGFDHLKVALSVGVQKMIRADLASSGVIFTLDTESGFRDVVFITAAYGLGENVVQGTVDPDEFYVHKPTFAAGHRCVLRRVLGEKQLKMVYAEGTSRQALRNIPTPEVERASYCLSDEEVLQLADSAMIIERHYSAVAGADRPMDIEWAKDGITGKLFIIQARPETVVSQRRHDVYQSYALKERGPVLARGRAVGARIGTGDVRIVRGVDELKSVAPGRRTGGRQHDAGLGAGHEVGGGNRHQPRWTHLSCRHRRPGAGNPGGRRRLRRDRTAHRRPHRHGILRGGR